MIQNWSVIATRGRRGPLLTSHKKAGHGYVSKKETYKRLLETHGVNELSVVVAVDESFTNTT